MVDFFCARARIFILIATLPAFRAAAAPAALPAPGPDFSVLIETFHGRSVKARNEAAEALLQAGPKAISAILASDSSESRHRRSMVLIMRMGPIGSRALAQLVMDPQQGLKAARMLAHVITPASYDLAPACIACLRQQAPGKAYCGIALVRSMSPKAANTVPVLRKAFKAKDVDLRVYAVAALGQIGGAAKPAVTDLIVVLKDPEARVRFSAVLALGSMGRAARTAAPALQELSRSKAVTPELATEVEKALRSING
jgi:HEAT repeat protein